MDYVTAEKKLNELNALGSRPGLDTIRELMRRLGDPQEGLKIVHVAGTNGKGSVIAYLCAIAEASAHYSCIPYGAYRSPALDHFRENIQVNGIPIGEDKTAELLSKIFTAADVMVQDGFLRPTRFETETALAFLYFSEFPYIIVFLETGMGGRDDATNIVKRPLLTVFTKIDVDHARELGATVRDIAEVKAGIIKPGVPVVTCVQAPEAATVIKSVCRGQQSLLKLADTARIHRVLHDKSGQTFSYKDTPEYQQIQIASHAAYQRINAVTALIAAEFLKRNCLWFIQTEHMLQGLRTAEWFGRFSVINHKPLFIADGAHNPAGVSSLIKSLSENYPDQKFIFTTGIFCDKAADEMLQCAVPFAKAIIVIDMPENKRLFRAAKLTEIARKYSAHVQISASPYDAVQRALETAEENDIIVAFGSLSIIKPIEKAVKELTSYGK